MIEIRKIIQLYTIYFITTQAGFGADLIIKHINIFLQ